MTFDKLLASSLPFLAAALAACFAAGCAAPSPASTPAASVSQPSSTAFQGLRTVIYGVDDLAAAKAWYADALGTAPYFDEPFYVGFDVGGYELGLDPSGTPGSGGAVAYWGVEDIDAARARLLEQGASPHTGVQEVGEGIRTATVEDPFGNVLGVIENPHFEVSE